jgi:hypothetical protein
VIDTVAFWLWIWAATPMALARVPETDPALTRVAPEIPMWPPDGRIVEAPETSARDSKPTVVAVDAPDGLEVATKREDRLLPAVLVKTVAWLLPIDEEAPLIVVIKVVGPLIFTGRVLAKVIAPAAARTMLIGVSIKV